MKRSQTRKVKVKDLIIGHQNHVVIQSMCTTKTADIDATIAQILQLEEAGCELVRVAIRNNADALAIANIKALTHIPICADIHFDYRLALACIDAGVDKIRINPGNIGKRENVEAVVNACKTHNIPIRIGINSGSIEKNLIEKYGCVCAEAMMESAKTHVDILESLDFHDIVLSFKSSDPLLCIEAYTLAASTYPYPLHIGVTEAGTLLSSAIKSSMALGTLLNRGIGDTMRISIHGDPLQEIMVAKQLLRDCKLYNDLPNLIVCPTCGRTCWQMDDVVAQMQTFLMSIKAPMNVAIMGCAVNGPGEAREADIAIAGGVDEGLLIKKGVIIRKLKTNEMLPVLKEEVKLLEKQYLSTK